MWEQKELVCQKSSKNVIRGQFEANGASQVTAGNMPVLRLSGRCSVPRCPDARGVFGYVSLRRNVYNREGKLFKKSVF